MKGKRIAALLLAGIVLLVLALWFTRGRTSGPANPPSVATKTQSKTNAPAALAKKAGSATPQTSVRTNRFPNIAAARTNLAAKTAPPSAKKASPETGTNAPSVLSGVSKAFRSIPASYYPTIGFGVMGLVALIIWLRSKSQEKTPPSRTAVRKASSAPIRACNVLQSNGTRHLW